MSKEVPNRAVSVKTSKGFLQKTNHYLSTFGIFFVFILLCIILSFLTPTFATTENFLNVLRQVSINGILAIGLSFVILTGGIDLSVGSLVALTGVITAGTIKAGLPVGSAILLGIGCALVMGIISGLLIAQGKLAPFIVTLAIMTIARGLTFIYSKGQPISSLPQNFLVIGKGNILIGPITIPIPAMILALVFGVSWFLISYTSFGRYIYAVGGNEYAAVVSGINAKKIKILVYAISGLLAGIASIILTSRVAVGLPQAGEGYELDAIAATVIGGMSLSGGRGRLWGTLIGALILGVLSNGLDLMGVGSYYQKVIKGAIILAAVLMDSSRKND